MKKIVALLTVLAMLMTMGAMFVSAADFTPKAGETYFTNDLAGKTAGQNGFTFYAAAKGANAVSDLQPTAYKVGQYDSIMWENAEMAQYGVSAQFWNNGDTGYKFFPNHNQIVMAYTSPVDGNVTFAVEAGFESHGANDVVGAAIRLMDASGKQIGDTLAVTADAPNSWGSYGRADTNNKANYTFEIKADETVYLYVEDTGEALVTTHAWVNMTYNRVGEDPNAAPLPVLAPEEGKTYHTNDLAGVRAGQNGFTFYAAPKTADAITDLQDTAYKVGQYDSIMWENAGLAQYGVSAQFWNNGDTGYKFFPNHNQIVMAFTSPVDGNITLAVEAGFESHGAGDVVGAEIRLVNASGKQIGEKLAVTADAPSSWGSYMRDENNNSIDYTFEIKANETVYLYVEDTGEALVTTHAWVDMTYNRVGANPNPPADPAPDTFDALSAVAIVAIASFGGVIVSKKRR